jgi:hypothetical protein
MSTISQKTYLVSVNLSFLGVKGLSRWFWGNAKFMSTHTLKTKVKSVFRLGLHSLRQWDSVSVTNFNMEILLVWLLWLCIFFGETIFFTPLILSYFIQKLYWNLLLSGICNCKHMSRKKKKQILSEMNVWIQYNGKINKLMPCCELGLCSVMWYPKFVRMFSNDTWLLPSKWWWVYFCQQCKVRCFMSG